MDEPRLLTDRANQAALIREIRYAHGWVRNAIGLIIGTAAILLGFAAAVIATAQPGDREARAVAGTLILSTAVLCLPALWAVRRRRSRPYARLERDGIIWGLDRSRDPWLPWAAIAKIRIVPSPVRLSDDRTFLFGAAADWRPPVPGGWLSRRWMRLNELDTGTPYVLSTNRTDCSWRELYDVLTHQVPGIPIVEGSLRDPS